MREATAAAHLLAEGISAALGLPAGYLAAHYTERPTVLFRIFRYPPEPRPMRYASGLGSTPTTAS
jgi:polar amino acid transport system ATP-binding protein